MDKADMIGNLKANNYSFEDKGDQVIVQLTGRYFLKLEIENEHIVKAKDELKQFGMFTYGKGYIKASKISIIVYFIFILLIVLWSILDHNFFSTGGKYFLAMFITILLFQLVEFWYYKNRLTKIKTLLHLND